MNKQRLKALVALHLPLTEQERAEYLLFVADIYEALEFMKNYKLEVSYGNSK